MIDSALFRTLFSLPFTPLPFCFLLGIAAWLFHWRNRPKTARWLGGAAVLWLVMVTTGPVPNLLVASLEDQYVPLADIRAQSLDSGTYIIVLGAGHTSNPQLPIAQQLSEPTMIRLLEGIRVHQLVPGSTLVTSGPIGKQIVSQAAVVRQAALLLGVAPENIDTLSQTSNTRDEALHFRKKFGDSRQVVVVTDAVHIPRAMRWFQKMGLVPIAAPTNYRLKEERSKLSIGLIPDSSHLQKMEEAVHEYLGMLWMGMREGECENVRM